MPATYQFRCVTCDAKASFDSRDTASRAGWCSVDLVAMGRVRYVVACPQHVPDWVRKVMDSVPPRRAGKGHGDAA